MQVCFNKLWSWSSKTGNCWLGELICWCGLDLSWALDICNMKKCECLRGDSCGTYCHGWTCPGCMFTCKWCRSIISQFLLYSLFLPLADNDTSILRKSYHYLLREPFHFLQRHAEDFKIRDKSTAIQRGTHTYKPDAHRLLVLAKQQFQIVSLSQLC